MQTYSMVKYSDGGRRFSFRLFFRGAALRRRPVKTNVFDFTGSLYGAVSARRPPDSRLSIRTPSGDKGAALSNESQRPSMTSRPLPMAGRPELIQIYGAGRTAVRPASQ